MRKIAIYKRISFQQARNALWLGLVLIVLGSLIQGRADISGEEKNVSANIKFILEAEEPSASIAAYNIDEVEAARITEKLLRLPYIYRATLEDNFGAVISDSSKMPSEKNVFFNWLAAAITIKEPYTRPLFYGKDKMLVGTLQTYPDMNSIIAVILGRLKVTFLNRLVTIVILFVMFLTVFYLTITGPIVRIVDQLSGLSTGSLRDLRVPVPPEHAHNELGLLIDTMNSLLARIEKQTEDLRHSENEKSLILDNTNEIIAYHDTDHNLIWGNRAYLQATGLSLESIKGKKCYHVWGLDRLCENCPVTKSIDTKNPQRSELTPKNQPHWPANQGAWFVSAAPVKDDSGKVIGAIEIAQDITDRKKAEEELEKYRQHLEDLVKMRTAQLEDVNKELSAFSYSVAHDIRAPLRSIDGFSKALLEECSGSLNKDCRGYLDRIINANRTMSAFLDDMLNLAHVARADMVSEKIDLSEMARSITSELKEIEPKRKVEFVIQPDVEINGDKTLIGLVIRNLLDNAWKFSGKRARAKIEFGSYIDSGRTVYFVRDNGAGFDMAYIDKLFMPFQRLHSKTEFEGTGIGLSIVQRIIHRHGGYLWAEGSVGEGATFCFTLPSVAAQA